MYTPIGDKFGFLDSIIVAIISILIVFTVLIVIISVASCFSKILINLDNKNIKPRKENKLLDEDEDAVAAVLVASIDYYNETKKHAKLVKITKEEE